MEKNMSKKKIARIMPRSMNPIGRKLATIHCNELGLTEGTPEFQEELDNYMFDFNDEAYGLSMTPSGLIGQNPATPKVKEEFFREMKTIFGENGIIQKLNRNEYDKTKFDRILRGNIVSLAHFILDAKFGLKIKGKNGEPSDFDYGKLSDDKDTKPEERKEYVIRNQYLRMYYVVQITKALEKILSTKGFGDENVLNEVFGSDWKKDPYTFLNNKNTRTQFIKYFYNTETKKQNPVLGTEYKKEYISKVKNHYFVDCVGLYFDKEKIDREIENRYRNHQLKNCSIHFDDKNEQEKFYKNIMKSYSVTNDEIMEADMMLPVVFGTRKINGKIDNFVILGRLQVLKAMKLGLPSVDSIVFDQNETLNFVKLSEKTRENLKSLNS